MEDNESEDTPQGLEEVTIAAVSDVIRDGAEIYADLSRNFIQNFIFYGKPLVQWATELSIEIPQKRDLNLETYRSMCLDLINKLQVTSNYHSLASSMADAIVGGNSIKKSDVIQAIVASYQRRGAKRPGAAVIEKMAESYIQTTSAKVAANIVKQFWKQRLECLMETRKIMEFIGMSLSVEIKWTSS